MAETENKLTCSICLSPLNDNIIFTPCIHGFHNECITPWLESKSHFRLIPCPLCKHDISILLGPRDENNLYDNDPDMDVIDIEPIVADITGERQIRNEPINNANRLVNRIADIIMNGTREDINRNITNRRAPTIIPIRQPNGEEKGTLIIHRMGTGRIFNRAVDLITTETQNFELQNLLEMKNSLARRNSIFPATPIFHHDPLNTNLRTLLPDMIRSLNENRNSEQNSLDAVIRHANNNRRNRNNM